MAYFIKFLVFVAILGICQARIFLMNESAPSFQRHLNHGSRKRSMEFLSNNPSWLHEGDIAIVTRGRKSIIGQDWPNAEIPYTLDPTLNSAAISGINTAISEFHSKTCIRFIDQTNNASFDRSKEHSVYITDDDSGCYSYVGRVSLFPQQLNLDSGCEDAEVVIHELGHAAGFFHEHTRTGRDAFVRILKDNIEDGLYINFQQETSNNFGVEYDYLSVMHYTPEAFAKIEYAQNTIQSIDPRYQYLMGTGKVLSFRDAKTAFKQYCTDISATNCNVQSSDICNDGYLLPNCKCSCPNGVSGDSCELGTETPASLPCGGEITNPGTYSTPDYQSRSSEFLNRSCVWTIKAPTASIASVYFDDFEFQPRVQSKCLYELVEIRAKGSNSEGPFYCDKELKGTTKKSIGNEMVILIASFFHDFNHNGMRFTVSFEPTMSTMKPTSTIKPTSTLKPIRRIYCGQTSGMNKLKNGESLEVSSLDYGMSNPRRPAKKCITKIRTRDRNSCMKINIINMDILTSVDCKRNHLKLKSISNKKDIFQRCGKLSNFEETYSENRFRLKFKTTQSTLSGKFLIKFTAVQGPC